MSAILLFYSAGASAFGFEAHRSTGDLAERFLLPETEQAIERLLDGQSLAQAATWPDEMRGSDTDPVFWSYEYSSNWHFVNIPPERNYHDSDPHPRGDAYRALMDFIRALQYDRLPAGPIREGLQHYLGDLDDTRTREEARQVALRFIVHLVGDLHQPLHVGHADDRGGNDIRVEWFGETSNLHRVWDTQLVATVSPSYPRLPAALADDFLALGEERRNEVMSSRPMDWLEEGLILRRPIYESAGENELGEAYVQEHAPQVRRQLMKAGIRLALLLNLIFTGEERLADPGESP